MTGTFVSDIESLRRKAREHMDQGPITSAYGADRERVIAVLNEALATEIVCWLRYQRHFHTATGIHAAAVAAEFLQHATDELGHADRLAVRIVQLRARRTSTPPGSPSAAMRSTTRAPTSRRCCAEDLVAERVAIASYSEIVRWLGDADPTTRRLFEDLLAVEEEHADDLLNLMAGLDGIDRDNGHLTLAFGARYARAPYGR
jgi:bacterioferritin